MKFSNIFQNQNSFSSTVVNERENSTDIEKASVKELFINEDLQYFKTTEMNISLYDNVLLTKYYQKIKNSCQKHVLDKEDFIKYNNRPEMLSTDLYGSPGLWYVLLFYNNCEDASEFKNLPYVLVPDLNVILECLQYEEYINSKDIK